MANSKQPALKSAKKPATQKKTKAAPVSAPKGYSVFLEELKKRIHSAQIKAAIRVNEELIRLYWGIGKDIAERQENDGWGTQVIERLGKDLQSAFPGVKGFSRTNLFRMRAFYLAYEKVPQAVGQLDTLPIFTIPWGHNAILIERLDNTDVRLWYAHKAIENGWSRSMLENWIRSNLHSRQGKAVTNFHAILPKPDSDLANQSTKDPYIFDFLTLSDDAKEKDIEQALVDKVQQFLIELGKGYAFVGRQVPLRMDDADYYIDLLFYNYKLHCFVVVELKNTAFKPEYAGKMGFYLAAVDNCLKEESHNRTIGIILCQYKNTITVEYALKYNTSPIGVSSYVTELTEKLPKNLKSSLPTIEEIEAELEERT